MSTDLTFPKCADLGAPTDFKLELQQRAGEVREVVANSRLTKAQQLAGLALDTPASGILPSV